jgi:hypothetical protein
MYLRITVELKHILKKKRMILLIHFPSYMQKCQSSRVYLNTSAQSYPTGCKRSSGSPEQASVVEDASEIKKAIVSQSEIYGRITNADNASASCCRLRY